MKKMLITNVVYGSVYAPIFLNLHLKSMIDESNIPAHHRRIEYMIFTDAETRPAIENHPKFRQLKALVPVHIMMIKWPSDAKNRYHSRYSLLSQTFKEACAIALKNNYYLSALVADSVVAKDFLAKMFQKLDAGFDSVFVMPMRATEESIGPHLHAEPAAYTARELFRLAYTHMHPLWVACHWRAAQFTKLPFSLLWNTGTGLIVRSYSITPIAFVPNEDMIQEGSMIIDVEVPAACRKPFWATDWEDAPIILAEPLFCFYPPFTNHRANIPWVKEWAKGLHESQVNYLEAELYYPNKEIACSDSVITFAAKMEAATVAMELMS